MSERALWPLNLLRPICPHCDGRGGFMSGYYDPEFCECECCNLDGDNDDDVTRVWRWRWWRFQFSERQEQRRLDRWINEQLAMEAGAPPPTVGGMEK